MAAGRGSIATSSRVSCIRLTTDATPTTKPIPSFGSRRPLPRLRTEILRRRPRRNARAVVGRPPALPDAPSAVVHSLVADRCATLSQASSLGAADRRRPDRAGRGRGPVTPLAILSCTSKTACRANHQKSVQPLAQKYSAFVLTQINPITPLVSRRMRGVGHRHERAVRCDGRERRETYAPEAYGEVVWS
jgi:hypothetical protein